MPIHVFNGEAYALLNGERVPVKDVTLNEVMELRYYPHGYRVTERSWTLGTRRMEVELHGKLTWISPLFGWLLRAQLLAIPALPPPNA